MNGFGFVEYKDAMDARDVVPGESLVSCTHSLTTSLSPLTRPLGSLPYVQPASATALVLLASPLTDLTLDGSDFMGERLVVQFARGSTRPREYGHPEQRAPPRPRRTVHRMSITGLPFETSWQVSNVPSMHNFFHPAVSSFPCLSSRVVCTAP